MVTSGAVYSRLNTKLEYSNRSQTFTDCNTVSDGIYCANNVANTPNNISNYVQVLTLSYNNDNNYKIQLCFPLGYNNIFIRTKTTVWSNWANIS
jgi:hypothetical protein